MWRSILILVKGTKRGLRVEAKLANCAHGPVLQISKIQNRELQFAMSGGANRSCQDKFYRWLNPDKRAGFICHSKIILSCWRSVFLALLCHITVYRSIKTTDFC